MIIGERSRERWGTLSRRRFSFVLVGKEYKNGYRIIVEAEHFVLRLSFKRSFLTVLHCCSTEVLPYYSVGTVLLCRPWQFEKGRRLCPRVVQKRV